MNTIQHRLYERRKVRRKNKMYFQFFSSFSCPFHSFVFIYSFFLSFFFAFMYWVVQMKVRLIFLHNHQLPVFNRLWLLEPFDCILLLCMCFMGIRMNIFWQASKLVDVNRTYCQRLCMWQRYVLNSIHTRRQTKKKKRYANNNRK